MGVSEIGFAENTLETVKGLGSLSFLVGHVGDERCAVVHAVRCADEKLFQDMIADAQDALPLGLDVVAVAGPDGLAVQLARHASLAKVPIVLTVSNGVVSASQEGKRLAVGGKVSAPVCHTLTWYRPPANVAAADLAAVVSKIEVIAKGERQYTIAAPPARGATVSTVPVTLHCYAAPSATEAELKTLCQRDFSAKGSIQPWVWAETPVLRARFANDGSTAGEVAVAMRDTFGLKVRTKDVKKPGESAEEEASERVATVDAGADARVAGAGSPKAAASAVAPKAVAKSQATGIDMRVVLLLVVVFLGAVALVVRS